MRFSELSPLAWRLLLRIGEFPELTGREQLQGLAIEAGAVGASEFLEGGLVLLRQMHGEGVVGVG
ncbi:hypothetical protein D3C87_2045980 [compost metagenome]